MDKKQRWRHISSRRVREAAEEEPPQSMQAGVSRGNAFVTKTGTAIRSVQPQTAYRPFRSKGALQVKGCYTVSVARTILLKS